MDQNPRRDKFAKAKIEEPDLKVNLRLPKDLFPTPDSDLCYVKIFGFMEKFVQFSQDFCYDDTQKSQQGSEAVTDSGAKLDRKVYRIRNKELITVLGDNFEGMNEIQRVSKATIGILSDAESNLIKHSFLDFVGTAEQVKTAEELILDEVLKTYGSLSFPVILMPPIIYGDNITIPLRKVSHILGNYSTNLLRMEMESGAWIKIEPSPSAVGSDLRVVNVFGPLENVNKAKLLIQSVISDKHEELSADEALNELVHQFKEPTCVELIDKVKKMEHVHGKESEDVGPTLASGCYGSGLHCVSHA